MDQAPSAAAPKRKRRDHRIDALRGIALLMMLADHAPQDVLNRFTLRNFGFADAAEIFVLLAGYASWLAYGRLILRPPPNGGWKLGWERILRRCWRLYLFQMVMLLISVLTIRQWRHFWTVPVDFLEPELAHGNGWIWHVLTLQALPNNLNILPLYIVLLACFPVMLFLWKISPWLLAGVSTAFWVLANLDPTINIPNWLDPDGWYFDPLAWQFIFVMGMLAAVMAGQREGNLPGPVWLRVLCLLYLLWGIIECFPYESWGLPSLRLTHIPSAEKSTLAYWRWLEALAILILVQSSLFATKLSETWIGQKLALLGRHSLEVFSLGTVLDLFARLVMNTFGDGWTVQVLVNAIGLGGVYAVAWWLDRHRREAAMMSGETRKEARLEAAQGAGDDRP
ncbi:OpgC family protein [Kozakia baliensis]|uniref:OpgC family protein n=1 Tax=Kozakia baliensis TaxID=153496 RepID=UPI00087AE305|nr:OpgC domain-containing protein [Kozakia baliensis]AOX20830.1 hypothetical protein A0U90_11690 [Kozakia baliensis]